MKKMLYLIWVVGALLVSFSSTFAQSNRHWDFAPDGFNIPQGQLMQAQFPKEYRLARLDVPALYQELSDAHRRPADAPPLLISIPNPEGGYSEFFISPTTVVADEVAHLYTVKTFKGYAKNARQVSIRCDISPTGFHAAVFSGDITYVIEPASRSDVNAHIVYYKSDLEVPGFRCGVDDTHRRSGYKPSDSGTPKTPANLRTYRLAIIADATYRAQFGGMPYMATNVLNSFASGINMVNAVYERDLGVHLTLVSNTTCADAVLTDHTDIDEVHTFIATSSGLGSGGFDVGHSLLWANTGGVAYLGVVCNNSLKGGGFSGSNGSVTQLYVDYMAHELGHQFGGDHTFASSECGTSEPNFRYETGEGSTIMAYAGVCGPAPSYQGFSDPYFHAASIGQINTYISSGGTCAAISTPGTGNNAAPTANAQSDFTIPKQTPFILVGAGTDANSDPITFSWEQFNGSGGATTGSPNCNTTTQPLFRFRPPTSNYRVFPQMSDVLAGNNNTPAWEKLPCVARTLNFRMTARDNNTNWGRTANDNMVVTVADTGPFNVTAPNGGESWATSSTQNVTWTVNGTDAHCINVDVLISTDNGVTYTVLGTFPNNGSASVTMPGTASATARVLVQCSVGGNFRSASTFFDVSNAVFAISEPAPCGLRISQVYGGGGNTSAPYTHDFIELYNGGATTVNLSGYSVQYANTTGSSWSATNLTGTIAPGKYYLVRGAGGANGVALPTPDVIGTLNLSATAGKVALVNTTTALTGTCPTGSQIIDFVGYGTGTNCSETAVAPAPSNTTAILRANNGCTDNNNNSTDFATGIPNPRNSASPANNCGLVLTITDNVCPSSSGTISGSGCGGGTVLEYATNEAGPWTTTAPTYTTSAITIYVRCRNTTTDCSGPVVSGTTAPTVCPTCPDLSTAPGEVQITNSTCGTGCTVTGGSIAAPTMGCPTGSSIQYNVNGGGWTSTLPTYAAGLTIQTRCLCDTDANTASPASTGVTTAPGTCVTPDAPTGALDITNSTCTACIVSGGSIAIGTVSGTGGTLEYSTDGGLNWSATLPTYNQTGPAQTILASVLGANGCRSNTTQVGETVPGTCTSAPAAPTGALDITNSTCTACTVSGGSIAIGTVSGTGGTLEYSTDGGQNWSATLPTYNQTGPAQTILASVADGGGCRSSSTQVGVTAPGQCTPPTAAVISGTGFFCFEGNTGNAPVIVTITGGTGPFTLVVNDGVTDFNVNNYNSGSNINRAVYGTSTYTLVSVTDANGCAVPVGSLSGSATMTQSPDDIEITGIEVQPSCAMPNGGSITLTITGGIAPYTFAWSNNETTQDLTNLGPGDYDVMVTDRGGCEAFETFTLDPPAGCCPVINSAPGEVQITNSTCGTGCTVSGGSIAVPTMGCPTGSSIQYNVNGGGWTTNLPTYAAGLTIQTRCLCDTDANTFGPASTGVTTAPGTCVTPAAPTGTLDITNSTCTACAVSGGSIALGTVSGTGGTLEYSTDGGQNWSATLPTYNQTGQAQTIIASVLGANGCRSNTTQVGQTTPGTCVTPDAPTGALDITNSTCTACAVSGGSIALGTVSGTGGTLEYSTDGGQNWSATLPTYNQTGPAQTIIASVLGANGCRSNTATVGTTAPGACTTPGAPTLVITNNVCPSTPGSISATGCGAGTVVEYATNASGPWSTTAPTYTTTAFTVYARCRNTTTDCVSSTVSEATQPVLCQTPCGNAYWNMTTEPVTTNTVANTSFGDIGRGNNNGTTTLITTASVSSGYPGVSGGGNAGAAARIGALNTGANGSAYFEVVVTPDAGTVFTLNGISFGSRSTGTGPLAYSIRTSANNYATEVAGGTLLSNSVWALQSNTGLSVASGAGQPLTIRIYGYNGAGSPGAGTANWRIDDLTISGCNDPSLCPALGVAPGEVQITNSTCGTGCTASGGNIAAPTTGCPSGSSIQYSTNGGQSWSTTLPAYNQSGPAQTIQTRCLCDTDANTFSQASAGVTTAPPVCSQPLNITCVNGAVNFNGQSSIALTPAALVQITGGCQIQNITANPASILCTQVGQTVPVTITVTDQGGITSTCTSQITVSGLPCNWQSANVNCNEPANNVAFNTATGQWTITSSDCYYTSPFTADEMVYARRQLCGDGSITALVTGINPLADGWAGVVMRETSDAGAKKAQLMTNLSSLHRREFRIATNGQSFPQQFQSNGRYWLRIVRTGNQFTMYTSPNGTAWYVVGSQSITMQSCIQVGLMVTSSTANGTVTATFSNVGFTQLNPPSVNNSDVQATLGQIEFDVFPNPTSGQLNIDLTQYAGKPVRIEMYSLEGKLLKFTEMDEVQTTVETLDLSQLQRGMYWVRVKSEGLPDATRKVVLNR
jgi:hypothetical protein